MDTPYYFINTFFVRDSQLIELEPIKATFNDRLELPKVLWGIDLDMNNSIQWVIENELWEGSITQVIQWEGANKKVLFTGPYFGL